MTRTEAIKRLEEGKSVTHPEIDFRPLILKGRLLFYKFRGKYVEAGNKWDFFAEKQNIVWDTLWEEVNEEEDAGHESQAG